MIRRYDSYKDSGVEWIGEIPEGWEVKKVKYITKLQGGYAFKSDTFTDSGIPVIRIGDIKTPLEFDQCKCINEVEKIGDEFALQKNDTLIALSGATTGKMCFVGSIQQKAFINQRVARANFPNKLIYFVLLSNFVQKQILLTADGSAQENISNSQIENISIALPPLLEQTAIASFLDRKTAEIDQLIANKEKLVALYEEEKTAIINRGVTRGLDPTVKTKPSGVDWLGNIPEHWEVRRLKYLISRLESGVSVNATDYPATGDEFGILKTSCVYDYNFNPNENKAIWQNELERAKVSPRKGSIIISRMNTPDLVGASGYVGKDHPTLFLPDRLWQTEFIADLEIDAKWLSYVFKCSRFRKLLSITATGTSPSMKNLGQEEFLNIAIPFMQISEQTAIVTHIETECTRLDTIIDKFKKQIELFKEYRTTLISEVVTGKIDVRGEVGV